ncbi:MAG: restriction endonuclease subunit S [Rickettsiales bacterium]|nr:restriction endonuclease subunit S [Rickettsiales bacterium]
MLAEQKKYDYLQFVELKDLIRWDCKSYFAPVFSSEKMVSLSNLIKEENQKVKPYNKPENEYGILGVNNKIGIFDAYIEKGSSIKQPYKIVKENWLAYNPYRVNVGSIGIKESSNKHGLISPAYVVFSCKKDLMPEFLFNLFKTKIFNELVIENTTGSVRQNLSFSSLGNIKIPLLSLEKQKKLVAEYQDKINQAEVKEAKVDELESSIDKYLINELGIEFENELQNSKDNFKFLRIVDFQEIKERWDIWNKIISNGKSQFPLKKIGETYAFASRRWIKKDYNEEEFKYIEINNIDPIDGISGYSIIKKDKAPSRATQIAISGDLVLGTTRPYLKRFAIIDKNIEGCILSSAFCIIEKSEEYDLYFLKEILMSHFGIALLKANMTGALYPAITIDKLKQIQLPLPPIEIQQKIAFHINSIKEQIKTLRSKAKELRNKAKTDFEKKVFDE